MIDGKIDISKFEQEAKPIDIKYYLIKYFRYWPLYVTCIFLGLIVVFLFHRYSVEEYQVQGSILIKQNSSPEMRILDRSNITGRCRAGYRYDRCLFFDVVPVIVSISASVNTSDLVVK